MTPVPWSHKALSFASCFMNEIFKKPIHIKNATLNSISLPGLLGDNIRSSHKFLLVHSHQGWWGEILHLFPDFLVIPFLPKELLLIERTKISHYPCREERQGTHIYKCLWCSLRSCRAWSYFISLPKDGRKSIMCKLSCTSPSHLLCFSSLHCHPAEHNSCRLLQEKLCTRNNDNKYRGTIQLSKNARRRTAVCWYLVVMELMHFIYQPVSVPRKRICACDGF